MVELDKLCGQPAQALTLAKLEAECTSFGTAWGPSGTKIAVTIAAALLVALVVMIVRLREEKPSGEGNGVVLVVLYTLEGLVYGALGAWAGASAGISLALLLDPTVAGLMLLAFALITIVLMIFALARGTADAGGKVVGAICFLVLAGGLVVPAAIAFGVPHSGQAGGPYEKYLWAMAFTFAVTGVAGTLIVTLCRGYHAGAGWLLVPLNASWGLLGNLTGLMAHFASLFCFSDWGDVRNTDDKRSWYVLYKSGFKLADPYDLTLGNAVSANVVERHEATHVAEHYLFGPIYPISLAVWYVAMFVPGFVLGALVSKSTVGRGIQDLCYYNNPWEVIAYRAQGGRHENDPDHPLVLGDTTAGLIGWAWLVASIAATIVYLAVRLD
jgi:hypothetical protein